MENAGKTAMGTIIPLKAPIPEKPTVGRRKNADYRVREYLTENEIAKLQVAAGKSRNPNRDRLIVLLTFRHALRVSELVSLQVDHIDLKTASLHVSRAKNGTPGIHGLDGDEMRLIRAVMRDNNGNRFLFVSERGSPLSIDGAQKLIERMGQKAGIPRLHIHMLRHSTGYALAGRGVDTRTLQAFMGHKNISNTVIYTAVADKRLRTIWQKR
jgi:site-specific recombinase XerD